MGGLTAKMEVADFVPNDRTRRKKTKGGNELGKGYRVSQLGCDQGLKLGFNLSHQMGLNSTFISHFCAMCLTLLYTGKNRVAP